MFIGAENRKSRLVNGTQAPTILHLATHARASTTDLEASRIMFSPAAAGGPADYLSLREVYDLNLSSVELAVLSACETERGPHQRGEGVQTFSRAFLAAGALTTVTTMWRIPDAPTADFMRLFYRYLQDGEPRVDALRRAKLSMLKVDALSAPHYWAPFALTGEGARPIPRPLGWTPFAAATAGILALPWFGFRLTRRRSTTDASQAGGAR